MLKKPLFTVIFLATLAVPVASQAQVPSDPATQAQVANLETTIRELLLQLIAQLQSQLDTLIAQQSATTQALTNVQSQVFGSVASIPDPIAVNVVVGEATCDQGSNPNRSYLTIPFSISGGAWNKLSLTYNTFSVTTESHGNQKVIANNSRTAHTDIDGTTKTSSYNQNAYSLGVYPVLGTQPIRGTVYDAQGRTVGQFSKDVVISNASLCPVGPNPELTVIY